MSDIINKLHEKIININSIYQYPDDPNFHHLIISGIDWPTAKDRNFFHIIRILATRGPMSLEALSNLHTDGDHPFDSVYQIFHRVLNGSSDTNISLQQRGLIIKKGRMYKLSPFGILYAIHVFCMDKYQSTKHKSTKTSNFSYQKDINGILDIIKKHYNSFSLFFDNLEYIKESSELDINIFFEIINPNSTHNVLWYSFHTFAESDFSSQLEEIIPFVFYYSAAASHIAHTKEPFKFNDSISTELAKTSSTILENMKNNYEMYREINSQLF